ncbi:hypothetical protein ACTWPB_00690 [Nocardia sp. IBHARD005]|uniref:hypothetical protein n=1 Tax=Nocardia sp. IBHARD005 TaxID=3457765 RepID=UPI0040599B17
MIALLLSLISLGGLGLGLAILLSTDATSARDEAGREDVATALAIGSAPALLLLLGAILLFRRKTAGRVILIILSGLGLVFSVLSTVIPLVTDNGAAGEEAAFVLIGGVVVGAVPLLIFLFAVAPSTGRWIRDGRPGGYQQYPQY